MFWQSLFEFALPPYASPKLGFRLTMCLDRSKDRIGLGAYCRPNCERRQGGGPGYERTSG